MELKAAQNPSKQKPHSPYS